MTGTGLDKKTSVLDYVVKTLYDKNEQDLLEVLDDLNLLLLTEANPSSSSSGSTMNSYSITSDNQHAGSSNSHVPHQFASIEIFQEYNLLQGQFSQLTKELDRNLSNHVIDPLEAINNASAPADQQDKNNLFASPTAKRISNEYLRNLEEYIVNYRERMNIVMKKKLLLTKKIQQLIEYFGEEKSNYLVSVADKSNNNSNSNNNINSNKAAPPLSLYDVSTIFLALKDFCRSLAFSKENYEWKLSRSNSSSNK
jgi:hypothetical protein